ncbi:hypothetical protein AM228_18305 [Planktothricoides sp. SR001]|uniref:hypothetical protein n=1 Tax=Planktothricoides sp. SR001 TaxID=1705388 RepID=UPI0006C19F86|nr:hypothetical protein [Planktothricoides sp. SR001]KOR35415.1 hypothetical protein AM228_18305 [Planktothricoides sp. SR001]
MSSASTGRYQSRFLNLLLEKSQQLSDRMGQAARQVQTTTIWTVQLLMYPLYAMFQTGRLVGKQLQQTVSQKRPGLPGSKPRSSAVAKVQSPPKSQPTKQPETALATVSESEADLPLPPLTDKPNDPPLTRLFHKLINWMETSTVAVKVNLFKESKLKHLPPTAATAQNLSGENMGIGAGLKATQAPPTEDSLFLKSIDIASATLRERTVAQLEAGQFPQWQEMTDAVVDNTRSFWEPVKNWYMWQGDYPLNLEDEDLTRDLWAEPSSATLAKAASANQTAQTQTFVPASASDLAENPLPQLVQVVQKSEAVIRTTITEWFGKVNALVHIPTVNSPNQGSMGAEERGSRGAEELSLSTAALHPTPYTLHPTPYTLKNTAAFLPLTVATVATTTIQKVGQTVAENWGKIEAIAHSRASHQLTLKDPATAETTSTLTQTETPVTGMGEPETGRDYIETKVVSVGYVKHPLQVVLEAIDWVMLRLEKIFLVVRDWLLVTRDSLFSSK